MQLNISVNKSTIFALFVLVAFLGSLGFAYGDAIKSVFVPAAQSCPAAKCVYGFDVNGSVLCRPCGTSSTLKSCMWEAETTSIDNLEDLGLRDEPCVKGEEYSHGSSCLLDANEIKGTCWSPLWKTVQWRRSTCRDGKWSVSSGKLCAHA